MRNTLSVSQWARDAFVTLCVNGFESLDVDFNSQMSLLRK